MILQYVLLVVGFVMLYYGAEWLVKGSASLARSLGITPIVIGLTVVAFGTSAPELIVSSTAVRARTTAELAAKAGGWGGSITTDPNLYASDVERVLDVVAGVDPDVNTLLIAGHEPTWSSLVGWLIGGGRVSMPTAAVACLDLPQGGWTDLGQATCELRWLVTPKTIKAK